MVLTLERKQDTYNVTFDKFCKKKKILQSVTPENIFSSESHFSKDCCAAI